MTRRPPKQAQSEADLAVIEEGLANLQETLADGVRSVLADQILAAFRAAEAAAQAKG